MGPNFGKNQRDRHKFTNYLSANCHVITSKRPQTGRWSCVAAAQVHVEQAAVLWSHFWGEMTPDRRVRSAANPLKAPLGALVLQRCRRLAHTAHVSCLARAAGRRAERQAPPQRRTLPRRARVAAQASERARRRRDGVRKRENASLCDFSAQPAPQPRCAAYPNPSERSAAYSPPQPRRAAAQRSAAPSGLPRAAALARSIASGAAQARSKAAAAVALQIAIRSPNWRMSTTEPAKSATLRARPWRDAGAARELGGGDRSAARRVGRERSALSAAGGAHQAEARHLLVAEVALQHVAQDAHGSGRRAS